METVRCAVSTHPISVIIPSARPEKVASTIRGLLCQTSFGNLLEIFIVTPHSPQRETHRFHSPIVHFITVDRLYPPGKMRNIGAAKASGDFLAFIDDDCVPQKNWLEILVAEIAATPILAVVGCRVVSGERGFWGRGADPALFMAYQYQKKQNDIDLGSAALLVRREAFEAAGGFDESLLASEDWDFSLRLREAGWRTLFTPHAVVVHYHGRTRFAQLIHNAYKSGYLSGLVVQKRHYRKMSWLAKISVVMAKPSLYGLIIVPYAAIVTIFQGWHVVQLGWTYWMYLPLVFLCHLLYHFGVWRRLFQNSV